MIKDKFKIIEKYIEGKDVLDCGCVGTQESGIHTPKFLHKKMVEFAKSVVGVDLSADGIEQLRKSGFNVVCGDLEKIDIGKRFDVIVAGDLIEHLSNPGMFLDNMKKHLRQDGVLILHTPNAFGITRFFHMLTKKHVEVNPDHACYYDVLTISQLLKRHGYKDIECLYSDTLAPPLHKKIIINSFIWFSEGFADSILIIARPSKQSIS
jgi:2-polyprenyl-3-methyl-5-hydroxy-6-metoxy-1,4-benzoquinol methylase